ncbi:ABC transporter ATP-binding protein [Anaerolinea thermophila]|uniref:ABC transporter ATP-binding protein n=3 Tax=Anaerolinea TaxID=233189 RepID=UPI0026EA324B|nr:ABC transporter ATP-binding protein [Anaerolinea thermophila]
MDSNLIEMRHMVKVYPPSVLALDDVSVEFRRGEIHSIVGENGAGKSTLMKVLYGLTHANSGEIWFKGKPVSFREPGEAIRAGIGMVHQEIVLIPEYTVWENIVLGVEPVNWLGKLDRRRARELVRQKIDEFQFNLDPDARVEEISVAARQKVEILTLLYRNVEVLILDEPTAVLTPQEIPQLFAELTRLRDGGHTILFISHRLEEVLELSDRITVMRKGKKVDTVDAASTNRQELARMMVGREVIFTTRRKPQTPGDPVLQVEHLTLREDHGRVRLDNLNFEVREGEIVGVAGVEGNGQFELVNTLMGIQRPTSGRILVRGRDITHCDILERRRMISFVPQDRGKMGASLTASVWENAIMTHHRLNPNLSGWRGILLNTRYAQQFTRQLIDAFSVVVSSPRATFRTLSGGNQQKVIVGRELMLQSDFVLLDQPTRGLDVGSMEYIHDQILRIRAEGRAVLMISADLEEIFLLSDRILVLYRGQLVGDLPVEQTTPQEVGALMLGGHRTSP